MPIPKLWMSTAPFPDENQHMAADFLHLHYMRVCIFNISHRRVAEVRLALCRKEYQTWIIR